MRVTERCSASGCERSAAASVQARALCREHFLSTCYEQLEQCTRRLQDQKSRDTVAEGVQQFLAECAKQATDMAQTAADLDNLQRAQLLDILLWVGDVSRRLRRSARKAVHIPVRLLSDKPGRTWEEDTHTQMLSRHGAQVECQHAVDLSEILQVTRLDTGQQASARVAWHRRRPSGRIEIGLAFADTENFWNFR